MVDEKYMRRALALAQNGMGFASPNPMVGAVIVASDGAIIGEGWHRRCGEGHAEVNAVASVKDVDRKRLADSAMYVTLEPCSHYGKTPPCAELIIRTGIPHVVVGTTDPFERVSGRGIAMLRDAGIKVDVGVMASECRLLNQRFFTAHTQHRPFITLKWARSADGFMDWKRSDEHPDACRFSNGLTTLSTMQLRSLHDAVLTTSATVLADECRLTVRRWDGRLPKIVILDRNNRLDGSQSIFKNPEVKPIVLSDAATLQAIFSRLYAEYGVTSVLVEAGATLLNSMVEQNLWDVAREEINVVQLGNDGAGLAPDLDKKYLKIGKLWGENWIRWYENWYK